jgi:hypothetical protein
MDCGIAPTDARSIHEAFFTAALAPASRSLAVRLQQDCLHAVQIAPFATESP